MFDKLGIFERYVECHSVSGIAELSALLGVKYQTVHGWKTGKYPVPWARLKTLVDEQGICWDWLIEGRGSKYRQHRKKETCQPLDRHAINQRFLSLFPGLSQAKLGKELGVNGTTVFKWRHDMEQVSWERLKYAVDTKGVTWEWLIEGR